MIVSLLIEFAALLLFLLTLAWLIGRQFQQRINRTRILVGALLVFFLAVLAFFGYLIFTLSRTSSGSEASYSSIVATGSSQD